MLAFIIRRGLLSLLILFLAVSLLFGMIHMVPGDPATVMLGPKATPELKAEFSQRMGLDQPLVVQLGRFYAGLARGDLGVDPFSDREVTVIVWEQLPYTLMLVLAAIGGASLLGIPLGCFSAIRRNSLLDRLTAVMSVAFIAIPSFVVALYLLLWLPLDSLRDGIVIPIMLSTNKSKQQLLGKELQKILRFTLPPTPSPS